MQAMVTRCPKCSTAFKITDKQIDSAKGAVRCGSCLHIFNAKENLVETKQATAPLAANTSNAEPKTEQSGFHFDQKAINDEYFQDNAQTPEAQHETKWSLTDDKIIDDDLTDNSFLFADDNKDGEFIIDDDTLFSQKEDDDNFLISDDMDFDDEEDEELRPSDHQDINNLEEDLLNANDFRLATSEDRDDFLISDDIEIDFEEEDVEIDLNDIEGITTKGSSSYETSDDDFLIYDEEHPALEIEQDSDETAEPDTQELKDSGNLDILDDLNPELEALNRDNSTSKFTSEEETTDDADESWAKAILDEIEKEEQDSHENILFTDRQNVQSYDHIAVADESTEILIDNNKPEELAPEFLEAFAKIDQSYKESNDTPTSVNNSFDTTIDEPLRADKTDRINYQDNDAQEKDRLLRNIQPEPVEMDWIRVSRDWPKKLMWWTLCCLATITLAGQFAWIKFDHWSRIEPYRPYYALACNIIDCKLPSLIDTNKIKVSNLVIRSHPQIQDALTVDAILINHASFAQPFPDLVISFSDLDGNTVAARRFKPEEYLAGELAGKNKIPHNQPIHLSMDIADPGRQAVNYQAYIPADTKR